MELGLRLTLGIFFLKNYLPLMQEEQVGSNLPDESKGILFKVQSPTKLMFTFKSLSDMRAMMKHG